MTSAPGSPETRPAGTPEPGPATGVAGSAGGAATGADRSGRDWARARTSDATAAAPADADVGPARLRRAPLLVQGGAAAAVGAVLAAAGAAGPAALLVVVVLLQLVLAAALLSLLDAPARGGAFLVAAGTALAADVVVLVDDGRVDRVAPVLGLGFVAALLAQLARRGRHRVTESIADTLVAAVVGSSAACLLALLWLDRGREVLLVALAAVAAGLLVARAVDRVLPRPPVAAGASRGWPGLLLALAAAVGAGLGLAGTGLVELGTGSAALLALAVSATAVAADLAVDLGAAELRAGRRDARRVKALTPVSALLPYALVGSVALVAGRLVQP